MLKTGTGHLSKGCGGEFTCACYATGNAVCRVVISGVTDRTCYTAGGPYFGVSETVNGTYDLPLVSSDGAGTCVYQLDTPHLLNIYTTSACTTTSSQTATRIKVTTSPVGGGLITDIDFGGSAGADQGKLFDTTSSGSTSITDCETGTTVTNDNISFDTSVYAYDGSAVVTFS